MPLRIGFERLRGELLLADGTPLRPGDEAVEIHLWNDHLQRVPPEGPGFRWAIQTFRQFDRSLRLLARELRENPDLAHIRALVIRPAFTGRQLDRNLNRIVVKLGFERALGPRRWGARSALYRFFDNLWLWLLTWTFNPRSLWRRPFRQIRQEFWMSRERFAALYGGTPRRLRRAR